jgi:drug/metabolite transporter (DMT)-like permease
VRWALLTAIISSTVIGDLLQSHEMKRAGEQSVTAGGLRKILRIIASRRYLILAIVFMAISFFSFMALVQIAPLSFAVPASAATFVLETVLSRFVLRERIVWQRAVGAALVLGGVILVAQ